MTTKPRKSATNLHPINLRNFYFKDNLEGINFHMHNIASILKPFTWIIALLSVLNQIEAKSHVTCYELDNSEPICKLMFAPLEHEAIYMTQGNSKKYFMNYEKDIKTNCGAISFYNASIFDKINKYWIPVHGSDWLYKSKYSNTSKSFIACIEKTKKYEDDQILKKDKKETDIRLIELAALFIGIPLLMGLTGLTTFAYSKLCNKLHPEAENQNINQAPDEQSKLLASNEDDKPTCLSTGMHSLFKLVKKCNPTPDIGTLSINSI